MLRIGRIFMLFIVLSSALSISGDRTSHGVTIRVIRVNYFDLRPAEFRKGTAEWKADEHSFVLHCMSSSACKHVTLVCRDKEGKLLHNQGLIVRTQGKRTANDMSEGEESTRMREPLEVLIRGVRQTPCNPLNAVLTVTDIE